MQIKVKENNFNELIVGLEGRVVSQFDENHFEVALSSMYYGKVYLTKDEFEVIQ